ncbi:hypothetical protein BWQ96_09261 [Gracilariopsis chorda]|uniref:Uncharacterized protein n=1 Tax=Gracilariopsis chorda TaxID=448386 RepID=A0A2V3IG30_9FLOR|nr:hypothetical protein BWQ96_09261 [Gracilariopsis chorda]|eukprot:PXF41021.1 hypothetical protein BWQ96_09261 [Gracilariopsis chorda]
MPHTVADVAPKSPTRAQRKDITADPGVENTVEQKEKTLREAEIEYSCAGVEDIEIHPAVGKSSYALYDGSVGHDSKPLVRKTDCTTDLGKMHTADAGVSAYHMSCSTHSVPHDGPPQKTDIVFRAKRHPVSREPARAMASDPPPA